jgi:hypothetical protein
VQIIIKVCQIILAIKNGLSSRRKSIGEDEVKLFANDKCKAQNNGCYG